MDYTSFLFSKLLCEFNLSYSELPYDDMYVKHHKLLKEYDSSSFNIDDMSEYDCIVKFMENRKVSEIVF